MKSIHLKLAAIVVLVLALGTSAGELTAQSSWQSGNAGCSGGQCQHGSQHASDAHGMSSYRPPFSEPQPYGAQPYGSPQTFRGGPNGGYGDFSPNQAYRSPYSSGPPSGTGYSGGCSGGNCQGHQANSSQRESYYPETGGSCSGGACNHQSAPNAGNYSGSGAQLNQRSFATNGSREPRSRPYFDEPRMDRQPNSIFPGGSPGYRSQQPADLAPSLDPRSGRRFFGSASMPSSRANPALNHLELYTANGLPSQGPFWAEAPGAGRTSDESRRSVPPRTRAGFSETLPSTPSGLSQSDSTAYLPPPRNNFAVSPFSARPNMPGMPPTSPTGADGHDHSKCNHNH